MDPPTDRSGLHPFRGIYLVNADGSRFSLTIVDYWRPGDDRGGLHKRGWQARPDAVRTAARTRRGSSARVFRRSPWRAGWATASRLIEQTYGHLAIDADDWGIKRMAARDTALDEPTANQRKRPTDHRAAGIPGRKPSHLPDSNRRPLLTMEGVLSASRSSRNVLSHWRTDGKVLGEVLGRPGRAARNGSTVRCPTTWG
jgi:hypothetical protein